MTATKNPRCGTRADSQPGQPGSFSHRFGSSCYHAGKVVREGQWYCGMHDPEAKRAKREAKALARRAEWDREVQARLAWQEKDDARKADALRRIEQLGVAGGVPAHDLGFWGRQHTGGVTLTPDAVDALIARLEGR